MLGATEGCCTGIILMFVHKTYTLDAYIYTFFPVQYRITNFLVLTINNIWLIKVFFISLQVSDQIILASTTLYHNFKLEICSWIAYGEWNATLLFQGRQGDHTHGSLTASKEGSRPQNWGNPKSIFQAFFTFLLWVGLPAK